MVVLDTSATVEFLVSSELGGWVASVVEDEDHVHAPHVLDVEVVGVLRKLVRIDEVSVARARRALAALVDLRAVRYPHGPLLARMWELRENVSARDAAFVALAELLGATLVTTDYRLARAPGHRAVILTP